MFTTVLVANRGAIAVRIIRTLKALGVRSVAVYAEVDRHSRHVYDADVAVALGDGSATDTYLDAAKLLDAAVNAGAQALHPGYGFLSENAEFTEACENRGIVFLGPTPHQIRAFGLKDRARALAAEHDVPLLLGSELLAGPDEAREEAARLGYPVMLKSTAGGGGIGMQRCVDGQELRDAFESVSRLAGRSFANRGVYLEKLIEHARHIEVQIFGDGGGNVIALGTRDCSAQRRNQKVIEEAPAPDLPADIEAAMQAAAVRLATAVAYRSAGTVEFLYDVDTKGFYFLEVNTRLQVEHGVTEMVFGIDLVEWMARLGAGEFPSLPTFATRLTRRGHAMQARLYAEDPAREFRPSAGILSNVSFPELPGCRIDTWVESGSEVPASFDPLLAKLLVQGPDRASAREALAALLAGVQIYGVETNLDYLTQIVDSESFVNATTTTHTLQRLRHRSATFEVLSPGTFTTVQDTDGRSGYWHVGVPPSGAFDARSLRIGNALVGNDPHAAGLEITLRGPTLEFQVACSVAITGAPIDARLNGRAVSLWRVLRIEAGQLLQFGAVEAGMRTYLALAGGIECPRYLGSCATFTLGRFGGHLGRQLRTGDVLHLGAPQLRPAQTYQPALLPPKGNVWNIQVIYGPHGAPEFFTESDIELFFAHEWTVHHNSNRTGVRLIGPKPKWARRDGGEAGMHPSNIHDNAYAFGAVDFTGDMPVILGPDGPSLGGFVCPATVIEADRWKLGQLAPGDRLRFVPSDLPSAVERAMAQAEEVVTLGQPKPLSRSPSGPQASKVVNQLTVLARTSSTTAKPEVTYRVSGDRFLLVEFGPPVLDIALRLRVHALMGLLEKHALPGMAELTPGIRSLQIHYDSTVIDPRALLDHIIALEKEIGPLDDAEVPSRVVHLPLSWNDPVCDRAIEKYDQVVRQNAPWAPSNLEFIRRINGLDSIDAVRRIVFDANYLVMGLGDVYLGAPVAVPLDPRHRLVTTKYNPARTWTAENSVGIGGSYLCVYGMEGPGGYQLVGRTLQMWDRNPRRDHKQPPWLLRFFDQIRFHEVTADELSQIREDLPRGRYRVRTEMATFSLAKYHASLAEHASAIAEFQRRRQSAFDAELERWEASGQIHFDSTLGFEPFADGPGADVEVPEGCEPVGSPVTGTLWDWRVRPGQAVQAGEVLGIVEAMKMEVPLVSRVACRVHSLHGKRGAAVAIGQTLVLVEV